MGKFTVRNRYCLKLISAGLRSRDFSYFDSALELAIPPYTLFVAMVAVSSAAYLLFSFETSDLNFYLWTTVIGCMVLYTGTGLIIAKAGWKVYRSLIYVPFWLCWRVWIILQGMFLKNKQQW
jgi:hypothetical protein